MQGAMTCDLWNSGMARLMCQLLLPPCCLLPNSTPFTVQLGCLLACNSIMSAASSLRWTAAMAGKEAAEKMSADLVLCDLASAVRFLRRGAFYRGPRNMCCIQHPAVTTVWYLMGTRSAEKQRRRCRFLADRVPPPDAASSAVDARAP